MSCIIHGLDKLHDLDIGSNILIVGAGIIGTLWSCLLHVLGHRKVIVCEPNLSRRNTLSQASVWKYYRVCSSLPSELPTPMLCSVDLGFKCISWDELLKYQIENPTYKADVCVDCSGNVEAMQAALPFVENGGTFLIFGVAAPEKILT